MATVRDLITRSHRLLGIGAVGEALEAAQAEAALEALNGILEQWSLQELMVPGVRRHDVTCTAGKAIHTLGEGGDFDFSRPNLIDSASLLYQGSSSSEFDVEVLDRERWARIPDKGTQGMPMALYYDPSVPLGSVYLWPVPSQAFKLALWSWDTIPAFADLDAEVILPPGYLKALTYTLAVELAPEYGREASATVVQIALNSQADIKRMNTQIPTLECDAALLPHSASCTGLSGFLAGR